MKTSPNSSNKKTLEKRKKEAVDFLKNPKNSPIVPLEETDPNIASINITQGADPNKRFKFYISVELGNLKENPEELEGKDLAVLLEILVSELGKGYSTNDQIISTVDSGVPLPTEYLLQGKRNSVIKTERAVLYEELWQHYAILTANPPFRIKATIFKKGRKYGESMIYDDIYITTDLQVIE